MPFLDKSVVVAPVSDCPQLTNRDRILTNFYHTNKKILLTSSLSYDSINILIQYFSRDSKPSDEEWLRQIRSLPLFLDVANYFQPILNVKAFVWPGCCVIGYSDWIIGTDATFIQRYGMWTFLGSAEQLSIETITPEKLYTNYIFPRINKLSEHDRYQHLDHIRLSIYPIAKDKKVKKSTSDTEVKRINDSKEFVNALEILRCIGPDKYNLKSIGEFCDHTVIIFQAFSADFQSLPEQLQSKEWLDFFKELGLKEKLEKHEYLELCNKVAAENVYDVTQCSAVLLQYLFSFEMRKVWFYENHFLCQVSNVAFVPTIDTSAVSWVLRGAYCANQLVRLNGAASETLMKTLWTVRPIVRLPHECLSLLKLQNQQVITMLRHMNIIFRADVSDVVSNVQNISQQRRYTDGCLFNSYPINLLPPKRTSLLNIMIANLKFLNQHTDDVSEQSLLDISYIPVYSDLLEEKEEKMVLVKPSCVLVHSAAVKQYHPYLHQLPTQLTNCLTLLQKVGVKHTLELHHIQIVLEKVCLNSKGRQLMDPNTKECVKQALNTLKSLLRAEYGSKESIINSLTPLYLPDTSNVLKLSTNMIYGDSPSYFCHIEMDLSGTKYSHFNITKDSYGTDAVSICRLLPEKVKPLKMSLVCEQLLAKDCRPTGHSDSSSNIETSVKFENNHLAVAELVCKFVSDDIDEEKLKKMLANFFASLRVTAVHRLKTQLILREFGKEIGQMKSDFFIETCESGSVLYVDHAFDDEDEIMDEVVEQLHGAISRILPGGLLWESNTELFKVVKKYLKAETPAKKKNVLLRNQISGVEMKSSLKFELGEEIPEDYHPWLDQNPYNIFKPMEYVGYEDERGCIIVAQVVHLVQKAEGNEHYHRFYYIQFGNQKDSHGKEVSILDLYKFVMDDKNTSLSANDDNQALVLSSSENEVAMLQKSLHEGDIAEIKACLWKELRDIWKLDPELRSKAVKRLYLKWHPDKNLDNAERAEDIFTYLKKQISILEKQEHTTNSESDSDDSSSEDAHPSARGGGLSHEFPFNTWNATAGGHRTAFEQKRARSGTTSSPFTSFNERMQRRPEEGWRWVKQAEVDFQVLSGIHETLNITKRYGHVCFMAHQVAEKALKGGVYALCGMDGGGLKDHELYRHACALETAHHEETKGLSAHASALEDYYLKPRYPNRWDGYTDIPADHYDDVKALSAKENSEAVLNIVRSIMP